ncbi:aldehyde dehydrogenase [Salinicola sp. MIT1003]|uniref:aldehyde dehydrogenase n=1 Tax=Salinicola sp. MIT1003 TaxID=1882734 RepID=UPI0008DE740F|nr:aldehyde dehydrogenase [Salinicola sp. MIT1003]OHZ01932.1 aldehyde dehydrogenase [Salinicola sp. MIT1003]
MHSEDKLKPMLIGSEWLKREEGAIASLNPATGKVNWWVSSANEALVERAVETASNAVRQKAWQSMLPHVRARILGSISEGIRAHSEELAHCQMQENGKVLSECRAQVASAADTYRYFAAVCETQGSEVTPARGDYLSMTTYEPYGVVAAITPWNSPLTMEAQKVAPALAAGNAVILKPSEVTSSTALIVAKIALEAGLPSGILNVLPGQGEIAGKALVQHHNVRMVSFTGGTVSGKAIASMAAQRLIPVALELGGKSPHIIFDDACIDSAIDNVAGGIFEGSGQSCVAGSRLFVQRSVFQEVVDKLVEKANAITVGLPEESGVEMGPLATMAQRDRVEAMVDSARREGGNIVAGGKRPSDPCLATGVFYKPTIITDLDSSSNAVSEEIFGPVLCVLPFDSEEDLVEKANDSVFGLAAGIWTANYQKAWRVANALEAGSVWINTYKKLSISTPFGGYKESGLGREKGISGLRLYQQVKSIYWNMV